MNIEVVRCGLSEMSKDDIAKTREVEFLLAEILKNKLRNLQCELLEQELSNQFTKKTPQVCQSFNYIFAAFCGALIAAILFIGFLFLQNIAQDRSNLVNKDVVNLPTSKPYTGVNAFDKSLLFEFNSFNIFKINKKSVGFIYEPFKEISASRREIYNFQFNRLAPVVFSQRSFDSLRPKVCKRSDKARA